MTYGIRRERGLRVRLLNEEDDTTHYKRQGYDPRKTYEENMGYVGLFDRPEEELEWPSDNEPSRIAHALAAQGRGSDTEVAHVARGELVVPLALQNPEVLAALHKAAGHYDVPLEMLSVGNAMNRINPATGAPEFGVMDWVHKLAGKVGNSLAPGQAYLTERFETQNPEVAILPPENAPVVPPSDGDLRYNPNGPDLLQLVKDDPLGFASALWQAGRAWQETKDRYEGGPAEASLHNGEADAWRHARWNQRMTNSIGADRAQLFADWNERQYGNANPPGERTMDLVNNQVGRNLTGDNSKLTVDELVRTGRLRTRPY